MTLEELAKWCEQRGKHLLSDDRTRLFACAAALRELADCRPAVDYHHPSAPNPELREQTDAALEKCQ